MKPVTATRAKRLGGDGLKTNTVPTKANPMTNAVQRLARCAVYSRQPAAISLNVCVLSIVYAFYAGRNLPKNPSWEGYGNVPSACRRAIAKLTDRSGQRHIVRQAGQFWLYALKSARRFANSLGIDDPPDRVAQLGAVGWPNRRGRLKSSLVTAPRATFKGFV